MPQQDAVRLDRQRVVGHDVVGGRRRVGHRAVQQDVVHDDGGRPIGFQHAECLEIVLGPDDGEVKMALRIELADLLEIG